MEKREKACSRTKSAMVRILRPRLMASFVTYHGDPVWKRSVRDWNLYSLHLLVVNSRDHKAGDVYMSIAHKNRRKMLSLVRAFRMPFHESIGKSLDAARLESVSYVAVEG